MRPCTGIVGNSDNVKFKGPWVNRAGLIAGDALFQTHENMEHLAMMQAVLGPIPKSMAQDSKGMHNCFVGRDFRLNWPGDANKRSIK